MTATKFATEAHRHGWRRRDILRLGAASAVAGAAPAGWTANGPVELVFAFGPDDTGTVQALIDGFNEAHGDRIRVRWQVMPRASNAYLQQIRSDFLAGAADVDVFGADIIWTAEFATQRWVADLSRRFHGDYDPDAFLDAALFSAQYDHRTWGVPWYTDAGMLFYRRDLLEQSGFSEPPDTWEALAEMVATVTNDSGVPHGLVFQGADYEGGVTNALEFLWGHGARVMTGTVAISPHFGGLDALDPNVITVDTAEAAAALDTARSLVAEGVAPEAVSGFRELESMRAFLAGEAVFMRNWPYVYGSLTDPEQSSISPEQVGIAPIPVGREGRRSFSCLGGWNLMINANSTHQEAAWEFIRFATAPEQQRMRAVEGGYLPTLASLYEDTDLQTRVPVIELGRQEVENARLRPVSPYYSQMSPRISRAFNLALRGELDGSEAVARLRRELQHILQVNR